MVSDTKDALTAIAVLAVAVLLYFLYQRLREGLSFTADTITEHIDARVTSDEELQQMLDRLDEIEPSEKEKEQSHSDALANIEAVSTSRMEKVSQLESAISNARSNVSRVEDSIAEQEEMIQEKSQKAENTCGFNPDLSWKLLIPAVGLFADEAGEALKCNELRAQLALHKKAVEELQGAKAFWERRVQILQEELDSVLEETSGTPEDEDAVDDGSDIDVPDEHFEEQPDVDLRMFIDETSYGFDVVIDNLGTEDWTGLVGVSTAEDPENPAGSIIEEFEYPVTVPGEGSKRIQVWRSPQLVISKAWRTDAFEDNLAGTGWVNIGA